MPNAVTDFPFSFDLSVFPEPPAVPPSSQLFSASESSNLFGFLDELNDWDFDGDFLNPRALQQPNAQPLSPGPYFGAHAEASSTSSNCPGLGSSSSGSARVHPYPRHKRSPSAQSPDSPNPASSSSNGPGPTRSSKPLLTDPQKRMNHIMSEQKRRNAIREGYAQLTTLLAPAGAPPGSGMPTRGRPKGSGTKGKGRPGAGKSGVLLRAVEYCRWLEEGRDALLDEVRRVEAAAGIHVNY
ncbi:hypothetical protein DFH11DRAFT_1594284 [Phellopilus nigrolimitatus]|nr:hypothetical protein DFH11DRAFT_1594284 [Phellopilus nigrolimitatus]